MFETITPIDNSVLVKREYATEEDIEKILSNSYSVREHWNCLLYTSDAADE